MESGEFALSDRDFARVRQRAQSIAGIALGDAKRTLVISRLSKLVRRSGVDSFEAYLERLETAAGEDEQQDFINALTTNLTRFWREEHHFSHLVEHIKAVVRRPARHAPDGRPRIRVWSAGCSTGQEPYTIAMDLLAAIPELRHADFRVLATDIDTAVLAKGAAGVYPEGEIKELSRARIGMFERLPDGRARVPGPARDVVSFKVLNLMGPWPMRGPFDAIFCRNVAIYFDRPTQAALFARLGGLLALDGYLYLGHSETASGEQLRLCGQTIYQLRPARKRQAA